MRYVFFLCFLVLSITGFSQVYNPIPQYVFRNKLGVGRGTPVDSAAYMNIGPNGGANAGVVLPRVADTLSILGTKRNGLLIFSQQLNKFAWWDSVGARWTEVGSGSGSSGGEVMLMNGSGTVGDSLLFSSVSGDTAYIRNLFFANGLVVENMGDTVLKVNVDSSAVPNIYTSDGTTTNRVVTVEESNYIIFTGRNAGLYFSSFLNAPDPVTTSEIQVAPLGVDILRSDDIGTTSGVSLRDSVLELRFKKGLFFLPGQSVIPFVGTKDTLMYLDHLTGQVQRATNNLTATATLDFPSTGSGAVADLTVTVTGAEVGDVVSVGAPNGSVTATAVFFAWVSATDTVTVRFSPKATEDPASGTFKIKVFK
jgi:hypothetical protein